MFKHTRSLHGWRRFPLPPNLGMSRQCLHLPQLGARQPVQPPHRLRLAPVPPGPPPSFDTCRCGIQRWVRPSARMTSHCLPSRPSSRLPTASSSAFVAGCREACIAALLRACECVGALSRTIDSKGKELFSRTLSLGYSCPFLRVHKGE